MVSGRCADTSDRRYTLNLVLIILILSNIFRIVLVAYAVFVRVHILVDVLDVVTFFLVVARVRGIVCARRRRRRAHR